MGQLNLPSSPISKLCTYFTICTGGRFWQARPYLRRLAPFKNFLSLATCVRVQKEGSLQSLALPLPPRPTRQTPRGSRLILLSSYICRVQLNSYLLPSAVWFAGRALGRRHCDAALCSRGSGSGPSAAKGPMYRVPEVRVRSTVSTHRVRYADYSIVSPPSWHLPTKKTMTRCELFQESSIN